MIKVCRSFATSRTVRTRAPPVVRSDYRLTYRCGPIAGYGHSVRIGIGRPYGRRATDLSVRSPRERLHFKGDRMSRSRCFFGGHPRTPGSVALIGALVLTAACGGSDKQRDAVAKRQALLVAAAGQLAAGTSAVEPGAAAAASTDQRAAADSSAAGSASPQSGGGSTPAGVAAGGSGSSSSGTAAVAAGPSAKSG